MAVCSGCTAGGCTCVVDGVTITGTGVLGDPFVAVGGGGGACQQKNLYTVSTIGVQGLGFYLGTAEPFLSCADFIGDGVNDEDAINAAITAAIGTFLFDIYPEVYLNAGVFITSGTITAQGVTLRGVPGQGTALASRTLVSNNATASGFPLITDPIFLAEIQFANLLASNAEAILQVNTNRNFYAERCTFLSSGLGVGSGVLEFNAQGNVALRDCIIGACVGGAAAAPGTFFDSVLSGGIHTIIGNTFTCCTIDMNNMFQGTMIKDNFINLPGGGPVVANRGAINLVHPGTNVAISNWQVCGNNIANVAGHGIYIDGAANPSGFFAWALVHDNLIYGYGGSGVSQFDGIFLTGNVDEISIQGNKCGGVVGPGARHGINISAATCNDNLVTNNDLFVSGVGASINDAGTATILAAGNRL